MPLNKTEREREKKQLMLNITEKMMPNKKHLMKSCWWRMDGLGRSSMFLLQVILLHLKEHEIVFCFFQNLSQYCASSQGTQDFLVSFKISLKTFNRTHSDNLKKNKKLTFHHIYTVTVHCFCTASLASQVWASKGQGHILPHVFQTSVQF